MADHTYAVVVPQIVGTLEQYEFVYHSDGKTFSSRQAAIGHGWKIHGHDDWLIAVITNGALAGVAWMHEDRDDEGERAEIARQIGLPLWQGRSRG